MSGIDPAREGEEARARPRPAGWALGLPGLALLVAVAAMRISPAVEVNLRRAAAELVGTAPGSPLTSAGARTVIDGRDVLVLTDAELPDPVRRDTEARASRLPAVRHVRLDATGFVQLSPYVFSIHRSETGIRLSGGVPDAALRADLVALAGRFVPPDQVEDGLRLASGAPPDFAEASRRLVAGIGPVPGGSGRLTDRSVSLDASPPDAASYRDLLGASRDLARGYEPERVEIRPPLVSSFGWSARRDGAGILLAGHVPSETLREDVSRLAAAAFPGLPLRDEMETARGLDRAVPFEGTARAAFGALALLKAGTVRLDGHRVGVTGETIAKGGAPVAEERIRGLLPSGVTAAAITVVGVPAVPFVLTARRSNGRVELDGFLGDERERAPIAALASTRFPGEVLVDRTVAAEGAPPRFPDATRLALESLSDMAEGEAGLRDRDLTLKGRVLYRQLAGRLRRSVPDAVPEGWRGTVALDPVRPAGALDLAQCRDLLEDVARRTPPAFSPGAAKPAPSTAPMLDAAADIVRRCGRVGIRVVHRVGAAEDAKAAAQGLAGDRAHAVVAVLADRGATALLSAEGLADGQPGAERTEFVVSPL